MVYHLGISQRVLRGAAGVPWWCATRRPRWAGRSLRRLLKWRPPLRGASWHGTPSHSPATPRAYRRVFPTCSTLWCLKQGTVLYCALLYRSTHRTVQALLLPEGFILCSAALAVQHTLQCVGPLLFRSRTPRLGIPSPPFSAPSTPVLQHSGGQGREGFRSTSGGSEGGPGGIRDPSHSAQGSFCAHPHRPGLRLRVPPVCRGAPAVRQGRPGGLRQSLPWHLFHVALGQWARGLRGQAPGALRGGPHSCPAGAGTPLVHPWYTLGTSVGDTWFRFAGTN